MVRMNPRQMKRMMQQMGIQTNEVEVIEDIVIKTATEEIVIKNPSVTLMTIQGQKTVQIVGDIESRPVESSGVNEEDVQLVMEQTGCTREDALEALKSTDNQPAEAIIYVMGKRS